jgi:hypothetical protein
MPNRFSVKPLYLSLAAAFLAIAPALASEGEDHDRAQCHRHRAYQIGLWGDLPYAKIGYGGIDSPKMQALIKDMNRSDLAFSVFDGDTKDGSSLCTDANIGSEPARLFGMFEAPVIYVPGDNEWTDCHRVNNGGYNPLERLDYIRKNLQNSPFSFGMRPMRLDRQGPAGQAQSENTRWSRENVYFVGLNVPGSNNNKINPGDCLSSKSVRTQADCDADNAEYAYRNAKNLAWLSESFATAKAHGSHGIMVVIQADPGFDWPETEDVNERLARPGIDGYNDLLDRLVAEAKAFDGQVALVHGDTHYFKVDMPLLSAKVLIGNITRVQTFGETNVHWVRATVDPQSRNVFTFEPMIVPGN